MAEAGAGSATCNDTFESAVQVSPADLTAVGRTIGVAEVPQASLQLQLAAEEMKKAKRLMADGKNDRAHNMALRAVNDAELAIALTREAKARSAAEAAEQRVEAIKAPEVTQ